MSCMSRLKFFLRKLVRKGDKCGETTHIAGWLVATLYVTYERDIEIFFLIKGSR